MVIAIDGPAGAGKSSVARAVAAELGFTYLDSGAMYRCVALAGIERGADLDDEAEIGRIAENLTIGLIGEAVELDGRNVTSEIRTPDVTEAAARIAVHPRVRQVLVDQQKSMIASGRYVAEGRDIGTVVSPDSPLKVFLTATPEQRARRRAAQTGEGYEAVLAAQLERDERDQTRAHSALRAAEDAVELDTTGLTEAEAVDRVADLARDRGLA
jgi:cytidylate kinase